MTRVDREELRRLANRLFSLYGDDVRGAIHHDWEADAEHLFDALDSQSLDVERLARAISEASWPVPEWWDTLTAKEYAEKVAAAYSEASAEQAGERVGE